LPSPAHCSVLLASFARPAGEARTADMPGRSTIARRSIRSVQRPLHHIRHGPLGLFHEFRALGRILVRIDPPWWRHLDEQIHSARCIQIIHVRDITVVLVSPAVEDYQCRTTTEFDLTTIDRCARLVAVLIGYVSRQLRKYGS